MWGGADRVRSGIFKEDTLSEGGGGGEGGLIEARFK